MNKNKYKGGAEKTRLKRVALLKKAANDKYQSKLFNFSTISSVSLN